MIFLFKLLCVGSLFLPCQQNDFRKFLDSVRQVETGGLPNDGIGAVGDNGKSYGPYQIQKAYWIDAKMPTGKWEDCLTDKAYAEEVMRRYFERYAPEAMNNGDWQVLARIHNGGPKGHTKTATESYWKKVEILLTSSF